MIRTAFAFALALVLLPVACGGAAARPLHEFDAPVTPRLGSARPPLSAGLFFDASRSTLCDLLENAAAVHELPAEFFARLIRAESAFNPGAVSPKGAMGIAQFMPGTAELRGLADPFDPVTAIEASADFLADLKRQFGNLGLAAAAYNAGPTRVALWIAGERGLPLETQGYVLKITGQPAEAWLAPGRSDAGVPDKPLTCLEIAAGAGERRAARVAGTVPATAPWGVQLAGNHSLSAAMASFHRLQRQHPGVLSEAAPMVLSGRVAGRGRRPFHRVQLPARSREEANAICGRLRRAGAPCLVQANR